MGWPELLGPSCLLTVKMCSSLSVKIMKSRERTVRPMSYRPGVSLGMGRRGRRHSKVTGCKESPESSQHKTEGEDVASPGPELGAEGQRVDLNTQKGRSELLYFFQAFPSFQLQEYRALSLAGPLNAFFFVC